MGTARRKRQGHLDDVAATVILQSYLDACEQSAVDSNAKS
jgi:RNase H-fold protein (predicted Holliday junction resolvase)